jgi:SOS-response transcriptional repressor LexA
LREVPVTDLSGTRELVYNFFVHYQLNNGGAPPSLGDVCRACYLASRSAAKRHVDALIAEGRLCRTGPGNRCTVVAGGRWTPPGGALGKMEDG